MSLSRLGGSGLHRVLCSRFASRLLVLSCVAKPVQTACIQSSYDRGPFRVVSPANGQRLSTVSAVTADSVHVTVSENSRVVTVQGPEGTKDSFNATWLRHNCQCPECVQLSSGQRKIIPSRLHPRYTVQSARVEGENLLVHWHEEDHEGLIPLDLLKHHSYSAQSRAAMTEQRTPTVLKGPVSKVRVSYDMVSSSEQGLWQWMKHLNEEGCCVVHGIPKETSVKEVVEKIWTLMPTIYGETFTVESTPDPINIAYSSEALGYHMDLVYYESPPGYQFLLCKRFDDSIVGGESLLVDSWHEAERLRQIHPDLFKVLNRVPATFQKIHFARDRPVFMKYQRPHIVTDGNGQITNINWAPNFEGPLCVPEEDIEPYYAAYHKFAGMLEESETQLTFRLEEGELLSFNNRRILHAREAFDLNGGSRILEGCYLNIDEVKSRAQVLAEKFNDGRPVKNVFNQSPI